jgi:hypothetical protein
MDQVNAQAEAGIGGWLILPLLALLLAPVKISYSLVTGLWPVFSGGHWAIVTNPASSAYHPLFGPLLIFEVCPNLTAIVLGLTTLWFFLRKSRLAPRLVIGWYVFMLAMQIADYYLADLIPALAAQPDPAASREMIMVAIGTAIWVPYFLNSQRVKATFIH